MKLTILQVYDGTRLIRSEDIPVGAEKIHHLGSILTYEELKGVLQRCRIREALLLELYHYLKGGYFIRSYHTLIDKDFLVSPTCIIWVSLFLGAKLLYKSVCP